VPAALAAGVIALLAVLVIALSSGDGSQSEDTSAGSGGQSARQEEPQGSSGGSAEEDPQGGDSAAPAPEESTGSSGELTPATPDGAVSTFYTSAAGDDYQAAWELATPELQNTLQGYDAFAAQQSTLESIEFPKLEVTEETGDTATVAFNSIARHTSYTDRCTGSVGLVRQGDTWMLNQLQGVSCQKG
jgi:hypothetical protein